MCMAQEMRYRERPWLKSYEKSVPENIDYEEIRLPDILDRTARQFPDNTALIFQGYKVTFGQLKEMVDRFATCLADFGVRQGDAVAILLPNVIPCVVAYFAALRVKAIAVMNNPLFTDPELERQFNDSSVKILVTLDLLGNRMIDLRPKTKIKQIVYTSIGDYLPFPKNFLFPLVAKKKSLAAEVKSAPDVYRWKDCILKYPPDPPAEKPRFEDVAVYLYTGGTTGISKGVQLTHANLSKHVQQIAAWLPTFQKGKEVTLCAIPFFHGYGMCEAMNISVYQGWSQVLLPKPTPDTLLESIRKFRPSFAPMVPTMFIGMLNHPDIKKTDMSCIKVAVSGSAPIPVEVIHDFERITGAVIIEGFGMTETIVSHVNPFAGGARKVGSVGIPISDTEARIVDLEDGTTDMPVDQPGELIIRGPQVMEGYLGMPEETANTLRQGWCYTGDIATVDDDGYFYIVERKKDMISSSAYKIFPRQIDEVFYQHPKVQEACTVGIPDPIRGENVKVYVVLKEGETGTQEEFIEYCKARLAKYKLPTEIEFREELPKTNVGKILRRQLRAENLEK